MAKVQVGFKFRPEVDEQLKVLAEIWGVTRTAWLEDVIMSYDLESEREAAEEERAEKGAARKASVRKGKAEGEKLVSEALDKSLTALRAGVGTKLVRPVPKAKWKT